MSFSILTVRDNLVTLLADSNTTTAAIDLSAGLDARVESIFPGRLVHNAEASFPAVSVYAVDDSDEQTVIGLTDRRDITINFTVECFIESLNDPEAESIRLADNIKDIIRNNPQIVGTTVDNIRVASTSYSANTEAQATFNQSARMSLVMKAYARS